MSLRLQVLHGCKNLKRPIADLNFVLNTEKCRLNYAISESFGFGGHNAAICFRRPDNDFGVRT